MAEIGLLGSITLSLCFFVLELVPHQAQGEDPSLDGLCTSSITIHGYKCQELQVRPLNIFYHTNIISFIYIRVCMEITYV